MYILLPTKLQGIASYNVIQRNEVVGPYDEALTYNNIIPICDQPTVKVS